MPESFIYLYHLDKTYNIPVTPESLPNNYAVKFNFEEVMNRTAPKATYAGSGPRTLNINLVLHTQLFELDNPGEKGTVKDLVNALVSCSYPEYDYQNSKIIPPKVLLKFGNASTIRGVINSGVSCQWSGPWLKDGTMAIATIQFTVQEVDQYSASYIQKFGTNPALPSDYTIPTDLRRSR